MLAGLTSNLSENFSCFKMIKMRADINTDVNNLFYCIFVYLNVSTVSQLGVNTLVSYETANITSSNNITEVNLIQFFLVNTSQLFSKSNSDILWFDDELHQLTWLKMSTFMSK